MQPNPGFCYQFAPFTLDDEGKIIYKGEEVKISSPSDARALGIATVHQELKNCDNLTVTENVFLGREEKNGKLFGAITSKEIAEAINKNLNIEIDKRKILLDGNIKTVGEQTLSIKLHPTVTVKFNLKVEVE